MQPAEGPETLALWDGHFWTVPARDMSLGLAGESCSKGNGSGECVSRAWGVAGGGWVCVGAHIPAHPTHSIVCPECTPQPPVANPGLSLADADASLSRIAYDGPQNPATTASTQ
ncbi:hypothetical protein CDV36_005889 [Fusarium kuroshium]|uniref:Uncharacterized protein n=1 Tax=Fusarium kuroshium TaxID=2010991 RepID=A0A3M2SB48_9HYPO|nr:hypothetical protein CDV36_005889 [Fusarium kuroshium]